MRSVHISRRKASIVLSVEARNRGGDRTNVINYEDDRKGRRAGGRGEKKKTHELLRCRGKASHIFAERRNRARGKRRRQQKAEGTGRETPTGKEDGREKRSLHGGFTAKKKSETAESFVEGGREEGKVRPPRRRRAAQGRRHPKEKEGEEGKRSHGPAGYGKRTSSGPSNTGRREKKKRYRDLADLSHNRKKGMNHHRGRRLKTMRGLAQEEKKGTSVPALSLKREKGGGSKEDRHLHRKRVKSL